MRSSESWWWVSTAGCSGFLVAIPVWGWTLPGCRDFKEWVL